MQSIAKKLSIALLVIVVLLFVSVYLSTPYLVRHFAKQPLADFGLTLDDSSYVTYNLLTSTLTIDDLVLLDTQGKPAASVNSLDINLHLYRLIFKTLHIDTVHLDGGHIDIQKNADEMIVAGVNLAKLPKTDEAEHEEIPQEDAADQSAPNAYKVSLDELVIEGFALNTQLDGHKNSFSLNKFTLQDVEVDAQQQALSFELDSRLDDSVFSFTTELEVSEQRGQATVELDLQKLDLTNYAHLIPDENVSLAGELSTKAAARIQLDGSDIQITLAELLLDLNKLDAGFSPWLYSADGHNIGGSDISIRFNTETNQLIVDSELEVALVAGQVAIAEKQNVLLAWDNIQLDPTIEITGEQQQVSIGKLSLEQLQLSKLLDSERPAPVAQIGELVINQIDYLGDRVEIRDILLDQGQASLHVRNDKSIENLVDFSALSSSSAQGASVAEPATAPATESPNSVETSADSETAPITFSLAELKFESPFIVSIKDESVSPAYQQQLSISEFNVGAIDTALSDGITPISLKVKDDEYFAIDFAGRISPFGDKLNADLQGKLTELTLTQVSPYMKDSLGFEMKSGQLDIDLDVAIEEDELAGSTRLNMRGLEMTKSNDYEQGTIKEGQAMPLNVALNMLKDNQGNIDLDVPVSGNVADPSFGISSFLGLILKKAAMSQAKTYLMQTFVPYANVVTVVMSGADYLLKLRLEPLVYQAEQVEISDVQLEYLGQLTQLLLDQDEVQVKTCAISTPADIGLSYSVKLTEEQTHSLVKLGEQRQQIVKSYLVKQGNVPSSRVLACAPEIDLSEDASPRIELKTD